MPTHLDLYLEQQDEQRMHWQDARAARISAVSSTHCHHCGEPIPQARRRALTGVMTCIDCQQLLEACGSSSTF